MSENYEVDQLVSVLLVNTLNLAFRERCAGEMMEFRNASTIFLS